jgi:hypothetical protein
VYFVQFGVAYRDHLQRKLLGVFERFKWELVRCIWKKFFNLKKSWK